MKRHPCQDCVPPKRHRACWDNCDEYKENKKMLMIYRENEADVYYKAKGEYYRTKYGWRR